MANHELMRSANLLSVFNAVRAHGPITKKELQRRTDLSWGSISGLTALLLERGVLRQQSGESAQQPGRTPKGFTINPGKNLIIGVDINLQGVTGVLLDLSGHILASVAEPMEDNSRQALMPQCLRTIRRLLTDMADPSELRGIGISFPGHVNRESGHSIRIQHLTDFDGYDICGEIRAAFGVDAIVDHDTNCIAMAQHLYGVVQDTDHFLLVRLCEGIGMAVVHGGEALYGRSGATGEIGHMVVHINGPRCQCGNHGCLETYGTTRSIVERCVEGLRLGQCGILQEICGEMPPDIEMVMRAAQAGDACCGTVLGQAMAYTGMAIANVANILDPDCVVLCGRLAGYPAYVAGVEQAAQANLWRGGPLDFRVAERHGIAAAQGAAAMFIEQVFLKTIE